MVRLGQTIDPKRMKRTLDMLKSGKNQLFAEVEPNFVRGIVRSQREENLVYSCVMIEDGTYSCVSHDLARCMGLLNEPCKHILVLLIGLTRAGQIDASTVDLTGCIRAAVREDPALEQDDEEPRQRHTPEVQGRAGR